MMASNLLSRLLPSASDEPFEPDRLPTHERRSTSSDEHPGMDIDEENLEARFEAQDLENLLADAASSQMTTESTAFLPTNNNQKPQVGASAAARPSNWRQPAPSRPAPLYDDDDVPESLLLEGGREPHAPKPSQQEPADTLPPPVPGPSTRQTQAQWETTRRHQRLHDEDRGATPAPRWGVLGRHGQFTADPREKALWRWVNVSDLDSFLVEVYSYYTNYGIYSILLRRLLTLLWVYT